MKYYFKSTYVVPVAYSEGWYGELDYAPPVTILLYDDNQGFCICYVEDEYDYGRLQENSTITFYASEEDALADVELCSIDDPNVWFGERLSHRWDEERAMRAAEERAAKTLE